MIYLTRRDRGSVTGYPGSLDSQLTGLIYGRTQGDDAIPAPEQIRTLVATAAGCRVDQFTIHYCRRRGSGAGGRTTETDKAFYYYFRVSMTPAAERMIRARAEARGAHHPHYLYRMMRRAAGLPDFPSGLVEPAWGYYLPTIETVLSWSVATWREWLDIATEGMIVHLYDAAIDAGGWGGAWFERIDPRNPYERTLLGIASELWAAGVERVKGKQIEDRLIAAGHLSPGNRHTA